MLTIGYIGNGKSTNRYHLPFVLMRKDKLKVKTIYRRNPAHDGAWKKIEGVEYTTDLEGMLNDPEIDLVCVCTSAQHYEYAKMALEHGKHCLVEKPFTDTVAQANELYDLAKGKGLKIEAFHNKRYESDFLTLQKVIEGGKLGELYELEANYDYFRPEVPESVKPGMNVMTAFYGHACHKLDQTISYFGKPDRVHYDLRRLLGEGRMNDYYDVDLYYGNLKVSVRSSYFRINRRPAFVAYGRNGMYVKVGQCRQEEFLKLFYMPWEPGFGEDRPEDYGVLTWRDENGAIRQETVPTVKGDYGRVYDYLYDAIVYGKPQAVTREQILTQMEILEKGLDFLAP